MTKVEELRISVDTIVDRALMGKSNILPFKETLDSLIAVVRVEEAERIRVKLASCWEDIALAYSKGVDNGDKS